MLHSFSVFILLIIFAFLVIHSDAKCHKRRTRHRNCCCKCEEELGSTATIPSEPLPTSSSSVPSSSSSASSSPLSSQKLPSTLPETTTTVKPTTSSPPSSSSSQKLSSTLSPSSSSSSPSGFSTLPKTKTTMKPPPCVCECNPPTNISKGIKLIGPFVHFSELGQCFCNNSNYYTTIFVPSLQTSSVPKSFSDAQFAAAYSACDLCLRTQDDIYYYVPQNHYYEMGLHYYCVPNSDPQDCAFYATFYPGQSDTSPVTLVSLDGKNLSVPVIQYGDNNTEPLGPTSSYLKVIRGSCAGCAILTADTCSPEGALGN